MPKTPKPKKPDRKPYKFVRIREALVPPALAAAKLNAQSFTEFVNDSLRQKLEAVNLWPPKS